MMMVLFDGNTITPLVHVAIYHGIVHGVGHGEPVHQQVDLLYIRSMMIIICYKHDMMVCLARVTADS